MNNNFMGQSHNINSGGAGVAIGQKTAYGFVGGISGQGINNYTIPQQN